MAGRIYDRSIRLMIGYPVFIAKSKQNSMYSLLYGDV